MLNFTIKGEGNKVVVFLHGFLENLKMWDAYVDVLSQKYKVISIDLPGHGGSKDISTEVNTMEYMANEVKAVLDSLAVEKCTLIGHSMGGYVVSAFAMEYTQSIEGVCLFFSTTFADSEEKKAQRLKAIEVIKENADDFFRVAIPRLFKKDTVSQYDKQIQEAVDWAKDCSMKGIEASLRGMRERKDSTSFYQNSKISVLLFAGEYDTAVEVERQLQVFEKLKSIEKVKLPIGHMGMFEAIEETQKEISQWLLKIYKS